MRWSNFRRRRGRGRWLIVAATMALAVVGAVVLWVSSCQGQSPQWVECPAGRSAQPRTRPLRGLFDALRNRRSPPRTAPQSPHPQPVPVQPAPVVAGPAEEESPAASVYGNQELRKAREQIKQLQSQLAACRQTNQKWEKRCEGLAMDVAAREEKIRALNAEITLRDRELRELRVAASADAASPADEDTWWEDAEEKSNGKPLLDRAKQLPWGWIGGLALAALTGGAIPVGAPIIARGALNALRWAAGGQRRGTGALEAPGSAPFPASRQTSNRT